MSEIRADRIYNEDGSSGPSFPNGIPNLVISGIVTATNVSVGSSITAGTFYGSGASLTGVEANGALRSVQYYTSSGSHTWTKPAGLKRVRVYVTGGGGGGGDPVSNTNNGSGGAGGGTAIKVIDAASLGSTESITVGAGGAAGNPGGTGGTSSFGSHCSATGGVGGASDAGSSYTTPGVGSNGDLNIQGCGPDAGRPAGDQGVGGSGGGSFWGGGGRGGYNYSYPHAGAGSHGGGGGGGYRTTAGAKGSGAAGGAGVIVVEEYF